MNPIHAAAQRGFSAVAHTYAHNRPDYPAALLPWLRGQLPAAQDALAVDLGAGTGKFTAILTQTGAAVVAVEPVAAMRAQLRERLPAIEVRDGSASTIPLPSGSADLLTCAQAFHWFATEAALAEIHRVLKPAGRLALVWNVPDESVDWVAAIIDIITSYEGDAPRFRNGDWRKAFSGGHFAAPELTTFAHTQAGSAQEVIVNRFLSTSFIAALPEAEKAAVAQRLHTLAATHPALRGRDTIAFPYRTEAYLCRRRDAA